MTSRKIPVWMRVGKIQSVQDSGGAVRVATMECGHTVAPNPHGQFICWKCREAAASAPVLLEPSRDCHCGVSHFGRCSEWPGWD